MPLPSPEVAGCTIVLNGSFNPAIFQPQWFAKQGLLPETEVDNANIGIVHPQVCQFDTERFVIQVTPERFLASTKPNAVGVPLRDLVNGTFYVLEHTPLQAMGINWQTHYAMHSEEAWHRIGDKLAPKDAWNNLFGDRRPGMRNLHILYEATPPEQPAITVVVQPSIQVRHGVYFELNFHFTQKAEDDTGHLMNVLNAKWEETQKDAERTVNHLLEWASA